MSASRSLRPPLWAVATLLLLGAGAVPTASGPDRAGDEALQREVERLRGELELAGGDAFYLRLDPAARTLELALHGVVLEGYPVLAVERGTPVVALWPREAPVGWDRLPHAGGRLEPARERDRIEIVAPPPGAPGAATTPPPLPATAEESVSVPERWRVVFPEGLSLEVRSDGGARHRGVARRLADAWSLWWRDWTTALRPQASGRVWLRVRLAPDHAAALYRALPPDVGLVVRGAAAP